MTGFQRGFILGFHQGSALAGGPLLAIALWRGYWPLAGIAIVCIVIGVMGWRQFR